jgi:ketopantoate hydroxymethyltransferase
MLTVYDATMARLLDRAGIDVFMRPHSPSRSKPSCIIPRR